MAPFDHGLGTVFLEMFAAVEMAFQVEMVVNRSVGGAEHLEGSHQPEAVHGSLLSPDG